MEPVVVVDGCMVFCLRPVRGSGSRSGSCIAVPHLGVPVDTPRTQVPVLSGRRGVAQWHFVAIFPGTPSPGPHEMLLEIHGSGSDQIWGREIGPVKFV